MNQATDYLSNKSDFALVRTEELCREVLGGISPFTLRKWVRDGNFPKPYKVGSGMVAWKIGEVKEYLNALAN